jgi:hypothetical protein
MRAVMVILKYLIISLATEPWIKGNG